MSSVMNDPTKQGWFNDPACRKILSILEKNGKPARFVGGCVRDALCGREVHDIDIATPELPHTVMGLLQDEAIKVIPSGIEHGTVTAILDHRPFEITTLRADVSTDGRRATVAFTDDWREDAARRDFTFNAMSLDAQGRLYDPFNGVEDLHLGCVRFIANAQDRIREDYLRLLRFFRFSAFFGKGQPEREALQACEELADGLNQLSGERVAQELLRLLEAPRPAKWVDLMIRHNILSHIIEGVERSPVLEMLCAFEDQPDPLRRLACLIPVGEGQVRKLAKRLRLSKAQKKRLLLARSETDVLDPAKGVDHLRAFLYRNGVEGARDQLFLYWAEKGFSGVGPKEQALLTQILEWQSSPVPFPLSGRDLLDLGYTAGARMGDVLRDMEGWWCTGGCRADKEKCLNELALRHPLASVGPMV